jgi:5-methyltetrahydrofolate--homocysteine methyltransferase
MADYARLKNAIIEGDEGLAVSETQRHLDVGDAAAEIVDVGLLPGMEVVGERMKSGECFIPEVLLSARTMQTCLDIVRPHLGAQRADLGTIVIGTVEGDLHDIGKNLVAMLLAAAGFEVINLGKGVTVTQFVEAAKEHNATILGLSGLLTTTVPQMPAVIQALKDAGLRDTVKVVVGGAPVTQAFAEKIGADGYGANAPMAVDICRELVGTVVRSSSASQ